MADKWQISECRLVTRQPTEQEKRAKLIELSALNHVEEWQAKIDTMPSGEEKMVEMASLVRLRRDIDDLIAQSHIEEWVTEGRRPTAAELKQNEADHKEASRETKERAELRAARIKAMRKDAHNRGLSHEEYMLISPSDITLEELNGRE